MRRSLVFAVLAAWAAGAGAVSAPVKKYIAYGWDTENISPADLLRGAKGFADLGMDGAGVCIHKTTADGRRLDNRTVFDGKTVWRRADVEDQIPILKEIARTPGLRHSMVHFLLTTKGRLRWDDDARWKICANNMRLLAKVAKETGLKGFCLDNEDYFKVNQYARTKDDPPYEESLRLARRRGRELFGPVFKAYPEITIHFYFMLNMIWEAYDSPNPAATVDARQELLPAFLDGILDVIPPTARIVDGCEMSYSATPEKDKFRYLVAHMTAGTTPMISPENRAKYRSQVSLSFATYMDAFTMTNTASCWYMAPMANGSRLQRLERNLVEMNRYADDIVWFWGERHNYVDYRLPADSKSWLKNRGTWEEKLPGLSQVLKGVKDPYGFVGAELAVRKASGSLKNLVDLRKYPGTTIGTCAYEVITNDVFLSAEHPRALLVQGVEKAGGFAPVITGVKPGEWYGVTIRASNRNLGGHLNWRDREGKFNNKTGAVEYWDIRGPDADGWYTGRILARVPEDMMSFVVFAWASGQKAGEKTYFDDFNVFKIRSGDASDKVSSASPL